ncbi:MAG: AMP-binding protein [Pirellulaceae bacterium]|nr:AMP-binding protein [Pirellulaceae bacterium]
MQKTLVEAFLSNVEHRATNLALVQADNSLTYEDLYSRAAALTALLKDQGISRGDRVLFFMDASADFLSLLIATWSLGAITVLLGRQSKLEQLRYAVDKTQPRLVVCDGPPADTAGLETSTRILHLANYSFEQTAQIDCPREANYASIVFTSGSTGKPKGVTQCHRNLMRGASKVVRYLNIDESDRFKH